MPSCNVKLFAQARDLVGTDELEFEFEPGANIDSLKQFLATRSPEFEVLLRHCSFAINREYAAADATLIDGAEIACIPPVSGG